MTCCLCIKHEGPCPHCSCGHAVEKKECPNLTVQCSCGKVFSHDTPDGRDFGNTPQPDAAKTGVVISNEIMGIIQKLRQLARKTEGR